MISTETMSFAAAALLSQLDRSSQADLDALAFGVIGFDEAGVVRRYNRFESQAAGLQSERVVGHPLFTAVAPCMNNFMVAQRFEDALAGDGTLDVTLDYTLTLRMRPCKVKLRLLAAPGGTSRYVLVNRSA